ncbi:hypothetical protein FG379_003560 [Cryptosporidium bovis]|uniref:uncharacterized protein n=1 Tax=Cryptosporidium bovis TaxID=310047 RepID=UPI00351AAFDD|nr:hypothetical protein FG379_003560 [Cryptosporidium bovis]
MENYINIETECNKFCSQIRHLWGDPFYLNRDKIYILDEETWEFAISKSKSIGITLELSNKADGTASLLCFTIYTSGKAICSNSSSIYLNKFILRIMTNEMMGKLSFDKIHNNGRLLTSEEMLFLVERGSLLLFSWSNSLSEWVQTPIMYVYNSILSGSIASLKLSEYLSYSFTRRSGYSLKPINLKENIKIGDNLGFNKSNNFKVFSIENHKPHIIMNRKHKERKQRFEERIRYVINTSNQDSEKNSMLFISRQPHENFSIERNVLSEKSGVVVSVISVNSETKFKIGFPCL